MTTSDIFSDSPWAVSPLLRQLVRKLLQRDALPDVLQPSTSNSSGAALKGLLTKGLGRFGLMGAAASSLLMVGV